MEAEFLNTSIVLLLHRHLLLCRGQVRGYQVEVSCFPGSFNQVSKRIINEAISTLEVILKESWVLREPGIPSRDWCRIVARGDPFV